MRGLKSKRTWEVLYTLAMGRGLHYLGAMIDQVKHIILVGSGKGGVGKSTVATNLALTLSQQGYRTGLLDADVYGPSIPTMLGSSEAPTSSDGKRIEPAELQGIKAMSIGFMIEPETAVIWRGPMLASAILQFCNDVEWGELDYLVFDLPPGTGDIHLTIAQKLPVRGAVLVTTPQQVALDDVIRAKGMFDRTKIPVFGVVENMSYFVCDGCDKRHEIFAPVQDKDSREQLLGVPVIGEIPLEAGIVAAGDTGKPVVAAHPDSATAKSFWTIADAVTAAAEKAFESAEEERKKAEKGRGKLRVLQQ